VRFIGFLLSLILVQFSQAQEISAVVLDANSRQPIPYATIQYGSNLGVITNDEGRFSIKKPNINAITVSSLGYSTLAIDVKDIKDETIYLAASNIELKNVFLTNKNLTGREIVKKAKENVSRNYNFDLTHKKIFFRESNVSHVKRFDLQVDKSTFPELDQDLMNRISENIPRYNDSYKEVLGDFYGNYKKQKIQIIKAANLHNPQSTAGLTELTNKLERILKDNIKEDSFLRIKTGLLGVKMDAEDLELGKNQNKKIAAEDKTEEQKEIDHIQSQKNLKTSTTNKIKRLMDTMLWNEEIPLDIFSSSNKYKFEVDGYTEMGNEIVYIISFEPKRGADFKGKMYVNTIDFGIHRIDYVNMKPLKKFRLLGISTADDIYRGKMIFFKNEATGKYDPAYLERETGESFGIDRPLTIIEKNRNVKGRRKQNELDMDIKINVGQVSKLQLVIYENSSLGDMEYASQLASKPFEYKTFKVYNPQFWQGYNIIEPNAAIKAFIALESNKVLY